MENLTKSVLLVVTIGHHCREVIDSVEQRAKRARGFLEKLDARAARDLSTWRGPFLSKEAHPP